MSIIQCNITLYVFHESLRLQWTCNIPQNCGKEIQYPLRSKSCPPCKGKNTIQSSWKRWPSWKLKQEYRLLAVCQASIIKFCKKISTHSKTYNFGNKLIRNCPLSKKDSYVTIQSQSTEQSWIKIKWYTTTELKKSAHNRATATLTLPIQRYKQTQRRQTSFNCISLWFSHHKWSLQIYCEYGKSCDAWGGQKQWLTDDTCVHIEYCYGKNVSTRGVKTKLRQNFKKETKFLFIDEIPIL